MKHNILLAFRIDAQHRTQDTCHAPHSIRVLKSVFFFLELVCIAEELHAIRKMPAQGLRNKKIVWTLGAACTNVYIFIEKPSSNHVSPGSRALCQRGPPRTLPAAGGAQDKPTLTIRKSLNLAPEHLFVLTCFPQVQ